MGKKQAGDGPAKARVSSGQSVKAQDGERRVETLFKNIGSVAEALRNEEHKQNVTSFVLVAQRADGALVSHTSQNLDGWMKDTDGLNALLLQALSNKWPLKKTSKKTDADVEGQKDVNKSSKKTVADDEVQKDVTHSYAEGIHCLNLGDLRKLVLLLQFDAVRKRCRSKKNLPSHMLSMLADMDNQYFDLGEIHVASQDEESHVEEKDKNSDGIGDNEEEGGGKDEDSDDDNGDDKKKPKHAKHGTGGMFVPSKSDLGPNELMQFQSWKRIEEEDQEEIDDKRYLCLSKLLDRQATKISNLTRPLSLLALRLVLEFYTEGELLKLNSEIHLCGASGVVRVRCEVLG
jgi:hypothetical protein